MGQRMDFIATARGEMGYIEGPKDNETKYGAFTKANFLPWCGSFVNWCANEVGGNFVALKKSYEWAWLASYAFLKRNLTPDR